MAVLAPMPTASEEHDDTVQPLAWSERRVSRGGGLSAWRGDYQAACLFEDAWVAVGSWGIPHAAYAAREPYASLKTCCPFVGRAVPRVSWRWARMRQAR